MVWRLHQNLEIARLGSCCCGGTIRGSVDFMKLHAHLCFKLLFPVCNRQVCEGVEQLWLCRFFVANDFLQSLDRTPLLFPDTAK